MDKFKIYKFNNENLLLQLSIYVPVKNTFYIYVRAPKSAFIEA